MPMDALTPNMGCSENKDEGNGGGKDKTLIRRLNKCFQLVKKRFPVVAYENIAIPVANALGLQCFTVSKAFNESSRGMIYVLVLGMGAYFQGKHHIEEK